MFAWGRKPITVGEVAAAVFLKRDLPDHGLEAGEIGVIVHCYSERAFEVE